MLRTIAVIYFKFADKAFKTKSRFCKKFFANISFILTSLRIYSLRIPFLQDLLIERHIKITKLLFERRIQPGFKIFIDIGAGPGFYSFYFAKKGYFVLSIEPDNRNFEYMLRMNRIFNLKNVAIIPCAISDKNYYTSLYLSPIPFVNISTIVFKIRNWNKIKVKTYKLDSLLKKLNLNLGENILIKIDAEGAEYKILLGMKNLIKLSSPTIVFECWGDDFLKIRKFLQKKSYKIYRLDKLSNYLAISNWCRKKHF